MISVREQLWVWLCRREERDLATIGAVLLAHPGQPLSRWNIWRESGLGRVRTAILLDKMQSWQWLEDVDDVPGRSRRYMLNACGRLNLAPPEPIS